MAQTFTFETEVCGRCGGTGNYSYNQIDGTRCFGCGGTGVRYTKRGKAALDYYQSFLKIKAGECVVGMFVRASGSKFRISSIEQSQNRAISIVGGVRTEHSQITLRATTINYSYTCSPESEVLEIPTAERRAELVAKALAYQETLTKAGKPRQ